MLTAVLMLTLTIPSSMPGIGTVETVSAAVKISKKSATLTKGQTLTLKVSGTGKKVKWTSNKKSIASVSTKGKVTARKKGTATITAKVGTRKYTCRITVRNPLTRTQAKTALQKYQNKQGIPFYINSITKKGSKYTIWITYTQVGMKAKFVINTLTGTAYEYAPYFGIDRPAAAHIKPEYRFKAF